MIRRIAKFVCMPGRRVGPKLTLFLRGALWYWVDAVFRKISCRCAETTEAQSHTVWFPVLNASQKNVSMSDVLAAAPWHMQDDGLAFRGRCGGVEIVSLTENEESNSWALRLPACGHEIFALLLPNLGLVLYYTCESFSLVSLDFILLLVPNWVYSSPDKNRNQSSFEFVLVRSCVWPDILNHTARNQRIWCDLDFWIDSNTSILASQSMNMALKYFTVQ